MAELLTVSNQGIIEKSLPTQADLSALQYHFVKLDSNGLVVACGANEMPLGILQNVVDGSTTEATATVRTQGDSYLSIAENVSFGDLITSTAASKGEVADADGEIYGARSLGAYTAASQDAVVQIAFGQATI